MSAHCSAGPAANAGQPPRADQPLPPRAGGAGLRAAALRTSGGGPRLSPESRVGPPTHSAWPPCCPRPSQVRRLSRRSAAACACAIINSSGETSVGLCTQLPSGPRPPRPIQAGRSRPPERWGWGWGGHTPAGQLPPVTTITTMHGHSGGTNRDGERARSLLDPQFPRRLWTLVSQIFNHTTEVAQALKSHFHQ